MLWAEPMLIERFEYPPSQTLPDFSEDHVFRYCKFEGLKDSDARQIDATFLYCSFRGCHFYWALFNTALFFQCKFENILFQGASFADCRFIDCSFVACKFLESNMGGPCTFEDTKWYGCTQSDCTGSEETLVIQGVHSCLAGFSMFLLC